MPEASLTPVERDFYEERRRRWRRSAFWRGFLLALGLLIVLGIAGAVMGDGRGMRDHIARVPVTGVIADDARREKMLSALEQSDTVRAVILRIDSPGGTTVGAEALYAAVRRIAETRPVVAVLGEVAASGGYIAALSADHIVARANTITGSVGVIMEYPDITEVLDRFGVDVETIRSSELKAEPAPWRPTNPAARARMEAMVAESYRWFRDLVAERRGLGGAALETVASGGVFSGRRALELGLIDAVGGERAALEWIESRDGELADLRVLDWEVEDESGLWAARLIETGLNSGLFQSISAGRTPKLFSILR